jgi:cytochrome b-561 domain containing protein 2
MAGRGRIRDPRRLRPLGSSLAQFFDTTQQQESSKSRLASEAEEVQPLDPNQEGVPLQGGEDEMGRTFDDTYEKPEATGGDAIAQVVVITSATILVITTWLIAFFGGASFKWFTWHPLLLSASLTLFSYGVLTLQPTSQARTKAAGLVRHQLAMIGLGIPVALLGFLAVFFTKIANDKQHFTSWHGFIGIFTLGLLAVQAIVGGGSVWFNGAMFGGNPQAKLVWKYHRLVGYVTYTLFLFTLYLGGAWSHWATEHSSSFVRFIAYTLAPTALIGAVYYRVRLSKMKFF